MILRGGFALLALLAAVPASAEPVAPTSVSIEVTATVAERCGLAPAGPTEFKGLDTTQATLLRYDFNIDCNTPFKIGVSSAHGALRMAGAPGTSPLLPDGFAADKPYDVALNVNTDEGRMAPAPCSSRDLVSAASGCSFFSTMPGQGLSSGTATALGKTGSVEVRWPGDRQGEVRRAAGEYGDTITVVIGIRT
jgi:spore coat protein U-like protein